MVVTSVLLNGKLPVDELMNIGGYVELLLLQIVERDCASGLNGGRLVFHAPCSEIPQPSRPLDPSLKQAGDRDCLDTDMPPTRARSFPCALCPPQMPAASFKTSYRLT
jgi:hypothetical protein